MGWAGQGDSKETEAKQNLVSITPALGYWFISVTSRSM